MLIHNINLYSILEFVTSLICLLLDAFLSQIIDFLHDLMLLVRDIFYAKLTYLLLLYYSLYDALHHFTNYKCVNVIGDRLWSFSG